MFKDFPINESSDIAHGFFKIYRILYILYRLSIIFGIFILISSIGLIKYKDWGRKIFVVVSWILLVLKVLGILLYIFFSSSILSQIINESIPISGFDGMTGFMKTMLGLQVLFYGILLVIIIRALFQIIRRFKTVDYKRLFY